MFKQIILSSILLILCAGCIPNTVKTVERQEFQESKYFSATKTTIYKEDAFDSLVKSKRLDLVFLKEGTYLVETWEHIYRAKDRMTLRTQFEIKKPNQKQKMLLARRTHRVEIKVIDNGVIESITVNFPDHVLN